MEIRPPIRFLGQTRLPQGSPDLPERLGHHAPPPPLDSLEIGRGLETREWRPSGLGLANPANTNGRVEANKPDATVAVIDGFGTGSGLHGESTSAMARTASGGNERNILRVERHIDLSAPSLSSIPAEGFGGGLDRYLQRSYTGFADSTRQTLENIRTHQPRVRDVSHSEGVNAPALSREVLTRAQEDPAFARNLARELGMPESTTNWLGNPQAEVAVARRVQQGLASSPEVAASQDRLHAEIAEGRGSYTYFNSAGNDGDLQRRLASQGFAFEPRWAGNVQSLSPGTRSVAAGEMATAPDGTVRSVPAPYSQATPNSVAFPGANTATTGGWPIGDRGTSYATPLAAGVHNRNPRGYERLLRNAVPPVDNTLGAGLVM